MYAVEKWVNERIFEKALTFLISLRIRMILVRDVLDSSLRDPISSEDRRREDPTLRQSKYMETALSYRKADPTKFRSPSLSFEPKRAQLSSEDERKGAYTPYRWRWSRLRGGKPGKEDLAKKMALETSTSFRVEKRFLLLSGKSKVYSHRQRVLSPHS